MRNQSVGRHGSDSDPCPRGSQAFNSQFLPSVSLADTPSHSSAPTGHLGRAGTWGTVPRRRGSCKARARRWTVPAGLPVSAGLSQPGFHPLRGSAQGSPPPRGKSAGCIRAPVRCCHRRLNLKKVGEHLMRPGGRSPACPWLREQQSPAQAGRGQGAPAPAAVPLGANLAPGGDAVLVLVCELVDLVRQFLHRARSEAAAEAPQALEIVHTLAVAFDSDAGGVRTAGEVKEGNMRPPSSRALAPATRNPSHSRTRGTENYRRLNCQTSLTIPRARVVVESSPCPPRFN